MTVRSPERSALLEAALAAWGKVRAALTKLMAGLNARSQPSLPPPSPSTPRQGPSASFSTVSTARPPVSLGESPTSAAEKPREGKDAVRHEGEQAVVGSQRARQLLLDVQRAPSSPPERQRAVDPNAPKAKIPPGPFRP